MKKVLFFIWQLPQHLLGLLLIRITGAVQKETAGIVWYLFDKQKNWFTRIFSGVSLGQYILLPYDDETTVKHEYGHSKQSLYFGWLYLLLVGVPSAVFNNLWDRAFHKRWPVARRHKWYYSRYPEKWADVLGGVVRE